MTSCTARRSSNAPVPPDEEFDTAVRRPATLHPGAALSAHLPRVGDGIELCQPVREVVPSRQLLQVGPADDVLGIDPLLRLVAFEILEPAIRVRDLGPVVVVDDVSPSALGVVDDRTWRLRSRRRTRCQHRSGEHEPEAESDPLARHPPPSGKNALRKSPPARRKLSISRGSSRLVPRPRYNTPPWDAIFHNR